jgi:hypothetical protein
MPLKRLPAHTVYAKATTMVHRTKTNDRRLITYASPPNVMDFTRCPFVAYFLAQYATYVSDFAVVFIFCHLIVSRCNMNKANDGFYRWLLSSNTRRQSF